MLKQKSKIKTFYWKSLQNKKYWKDWEKLAKSGGSFEFDLDCINEELNDFSKDVVGLIKELYRNYNLIHIFDDKSLEGFINLLRKNKHFD